MGTFDYVAFPNSDSEFGDGFDYAQLKNWDRMMRTYRVGDPVPTINLNPHSIKSQEGYGWVNIKNRCIESLTNGPLYLEIYDKWGNLLNDIDDETDLNNPVMQAVVAIEKEQLEKLKQQPYVDKIEIIKSWNPKFPQDQKCSDPTCNHQYYRHFDSYTENMDAIGCKYCSCYTFKD